MRQREILKCSKHISESRLEFTTWQMKLFCLVIERLQPLFNKEIDWLNIEYRQLKDILPFNRHNEFPIKIDLSKIDKHRNKGRVIKEIEKMNSIPIEIKDNEHGTWGVTKFYMFHKMHLENRGEYWVYLSTYAARWLMDFGSKMGYLSFHSPSLMSLSNPYSMKLYLILSQWYSKKSLTVKISEFKNMLVSPNYTPQDLAKKIIKVAQKEYDTKETLLRFNWKYTTKEEVTGVGRKPFDTIEIKIYDSRKKEEFIEYCNNKY